MSEQSETPTTVHPAIELLLSRVASNPEEFIGNAPKAPYIQKLLYAYLQYFSPEEVALYERAKAIAGMDRFHQELMKEIMCDRTPEPEADADAKTVYERNKQRALEHSVAAKQAEMEAQQRAYIQGSKQYSPYANTNSLSNSPPNTYPTTDNLLGKLGGYFK